MTIARSAIEAVIADALSEAQRTGKIQYVQAMNWDELYASLGFTDDPEFNIGNRHAVVHADGKVERNWLPK